jgi:hypothetical protein
MLWIVWKIMSPRRMGKVKQCLRVLGAKSLHVTCNRWHSFFLSNPSHINLVGESTFGDLDHSKLKGQMRPAITGSEGVKLPLQAQNVDKHFFITG